jgi:hypothetical protein
MIFFLCTSSRLIAFHIGVGAGRWNAPTAPNYNLVSGRPYVRENLCGLPESLSRKCLLDVAEVSDSLSSVANIQAPSCQLARRNLPFRKICAQPHTPKREVARFAFVTMPTNMMQRKACGEQRAHVHASLLCQECCNMV